jgi:hypothetical protein
MRSDLTRLLFSLMKLFLKFVAGKEWSGCLVDIENPDRRSGSFEVAFPSFNLTNAS